MGRFDEKVYLNFGVWWNFTTWGIFCTEIDGNCFTSFYLFKKISLCIWLLVCLGFSTHYRISTHLETSPLPVKGYKFWPMLGTHDPQGRESSLACQTYCDTDRVMQPFIMVISEDPWHSNQLPTVLLWSCHYLF